MIIGCKWAIQSQHDPVPVFCSRTLPMQASPRRKVAWVHIHSEQLLSQLLFFDFHHSWFCQYHCLNLGLKMGSNLELTYYVGWKCACPQLGGKVTHILSLFLFMYQKTPVIFFQNMKCKQILQTYPVNSMNCSHAFSKISGHPVIRRENPELLKWVIFAP